MARKQAQKRDYVKRQRKAEVSNLWFAYVAIAGREELDSESFLAALDRSNVDAFEQLWPNAESWFLSLAAEAAAAETG